MFFAPLAAASIARAADFEVEAETIGQGYQLRQCDDAGRCDTLLDRRRLTQYLNLHAFRILPDDWTGPRHDRNHLYFTSSLRFDTDFGNYLNAPASGRIPELPRAQSADEFQLLYAVLGGVDMFGFLDFQLGRQIVFDLMDFYSFDGLDVKVRLPWWVALEAWSGLEVRDEAPIASPIYELDGTSRGSRDAATCLRLAVGRPGDPCPDQHDMIAPTFGFAFESWGIQIFHGRLAYRRTFSDTAGRTAGDGLPPQGFNEEKLSYTLNANLGSFRPFGGLRYNLMLGALDQIEGGVKLGFAAGHSVLGEYIYNAPSFDGDSIFNVFAVFAYNDLRLTYTTPELGDGLRMWASGFVRFFNDSTADVHALPACSPMPCTPANPPDNRTATPATDSEAVGVTAGGRYKLSGRGHVRADAYYDNGFGGLRVGGDVSGRYQVVLDKLDLEGRLTLIHFEPDLQKQNGFEATSFGAQAGALYTMTQGVRLHLLVEENNNRYYNYQLRAIALLDLTFLR